MKPLMLDLYCCAGGAAKGYHDAGFEVIGVDKEPQPRYPYTFIQADAIEFVRAYGHLFDARHASPPCQAFSKTRTLHTNTHPDLVAETREALIEVGGPYVIENVVGAPLIDPLTLCGSEFDLVAEDVDGVPLKLLRHRLFESNMDLEGNGGCRHDPTVLTASVYGAGGGWTPKHRDSPTRRGGYVPHTDVCRRLLGVDWTTKHELSQVVPPAFTEHIGRQLLAQIALEVQEVRS